MTGQETHSRGGSQRRRRRTPLPVLGMSGELLALAGLLVILLPMLLMRGPVYWEWVPTAAGEQSLETNLLDSLGSPYLPIALAMLLALQLRVIDLGVWGIASLGAVVVWLSLSAGLSALQALVLGAAVGAAAGGVHAALLRLTRLPATLVTLLGGIGWMVLSRALRSALDLTPLAYDAMGLDLPGELVSLRSWLIFLALWPWGMLLLVRRMPGIRPRLDRLGRQRRRPRIALTLVAGGLLAGWGGGLLTFTAGGYVGGGFPVGDLRVLAGPLLCGALTVRTRRGRALVRTVLPVAMLVSSAWLWLVWNQQSVLTLLAPWLRGHDGPIWNYLVPQTELSLALLTALIAGIALAERPAAGRRGLQSGCVLAAVLSVLVIAAAEWFPLERTRLIQSLAGLTWLAAVAGGSWLWLRRPVPQEELPGLPDPAEMQTQDDDEPEPTIYRFPSPAQPEPEPENDRSGA